MAALPTLKSAQKNIRRTHNVRRTTNKLIRAFGKVGGVYRNTLPPLRHRYDLGDRGGTQNLTLLALLRGLSRRPQRDQLRQVRGTANGDRARTGTTKLTPQPAPKPRARRAYATKGWWVDARADGVYKSMIAAGYTATEAEIAVDRVYLEEEQRMEAEQRYLDWLHGYDPVRGEPTASKPPPEHRR
jgi:hypothetical protein